MADEQKNKVAVVAESFKDDLRMSLGTDNIGLKVLENGRTKCSCRWKKCKRHGSCKECIEHHRSHVKHPLPYCKNTKTKESKEG